METQNAKPASERQKQFIQKLTEQKNLKIDMDLESLDMPTASRTINELLSSGKDGESSVANLSGSKAVDSVKLGLAMKLVYNNWRYNVNAICSDKSLRNVFVGQVLETYGIFLEIEQKAAEVFGGTK